MAPRRSASGSVPPRRRACGQPRRAAKISTKPTSAASSVTARPATSDTPRLSWKSESGVSVGYRR